MMCTSAYSDAIVEIRDSLRELEEGVAEEDVGEPAAPPEKLTPVRFAQNLIDGVAKIQRKKKKRKSKKKVKKDPDAEGFFPKLVKKRRAMSKARRD